MGLFRRPVLVEGAYPGSRDAVAHAPPRRGPAVHVLLFAVTFVTTAMASAFNQGADLFADPSAITAGLPFAITVMTILLCHELGHYVLAHAHGVDASLPFFIPAPPIFLVGTFGAFIRMRSMPPNRRALFDIGAAGPWAGFLVALPAVILGLHLSEIRPLQPSEGGLILGDSLLFSALIKLVLGVRADEATILLHPVALAGWFGFLVTCLNLLPVGQLDGGHVSYAVFGRYHTWISRGVLVALVVLGSGGWPGWFLWAGLLLLLGIRHPRPWDPVTPLDRRRRIGAALTLGVFILTFMPEPMSFTEPAPEPVYEGDLVPVSAPPPVRGLIIPL